MHHLRFALNHILYCCSFLVPRSKDCWVFIGWHGRDGSETFADNCKYLFLHVSNKHRDIGAVWLAKDKNLAERLQKRGYRSYYHYSARGVWCALRAGTTFVDAYLKPENFRWAGGTRLVQLLHGRGMKRDGYHEPPPRRQDYILSPSPFVSSLLPAQFVQDSPIVITGYSRAEILLGPMDGSDIDTDAPTQALLAKPGFTKRLLYAPTFRRGAQIADLQQALDMERLSAWLAQHNYLLVISLHPKYFHQARALAYSHIHFLPESDIYPLLSSFDILINDYSSIFTDFLLLDRPIVFYPYDLEAYAGKEGFSFAYDEYTPGPKAYTSAELLATLEKTLAQDMHAADRARVRDLYHTYQDGLANERIVSLLKRQ